MIKNHDLDQINPPNIFCTTIRKPGILRKALKGRNISAMGIAHRSISDGSISTKYAMICEKMIKNHDLDQINPPNIFCTTIRKPGILRKALKGRNISAMGIAHRNISIARRTISDGHRPSKYDAKQKETEHCCPVSRKHLKPY
jgi:hypothetical protein